MVAETGDWTTGKVKRWCMFCHSELEEDMDPGLDDVLPGRRLLGSAPIGRFYIHKTTGNHGCASETNPPLPEQGK